jgi:hypothetical protein
MYIMEEEEEAEEEAEGEEVKRLLTRKSALDDRT